MRHCKLLLVFTGSRFGAGSLTISKLMVDLCACVSDPSAEVRDAATNTVVEVYRHVGERFRLDIEKRDAIPQPKRMSLFQQFDALEASGCVLASHDDDDDRASVKSFASSASQKKRPPLVRVCCSCLATHAARQPGASSRISVTDSRRGSVMVCGCVARLDLTCTGRRIAGDGQGRAGRRGVQRRRPRHGARHRRLGGRD